MILLTGQNEKIQTTEQPRWNEFHKCWYATGFRWIKTKKAFSKSEILHNFETYQEET